MPRPPARRARTARRRRVHWVISGLVAATVAVAGFRVGEGEYWASLDLTITDVTVSLPILHGLRRELLDQAWAKFSATPAPWRIGLDEPARRLHVEILSPDPGEARVSLEALGTAFMDRIRGLVDQARSEPGPDEAVLLELRQRWSGELTALTGAMCQMEPTLSGADREAVEAELRRQLTTRRTACAQNRSRIQDAEAQLAALSAAPLPERGPVDAEVRERALQADPEVQQDFRALRVQLAEARHQLLQVWDVAAPALEELTTAAGQLETLCGGGEIQSATVELRRAAERIGQSAADYRAPLSEFARAWTIEFNRLRTLPDDLGQAEVIDVQTALNDALGGFLFQSSAPLAAIRDEVRALATASAAPAEHHEAVSALLRTFHAFQSAHHRLEFAAADARLSNNFRLEAALKSATGLRYRTRQRLAEIEERLSAQALDELRAERERRVAALQTQLHELRQTLDASVDTLLATQERVDEQAPVLQEFLQSKTAAGFYAPRIEDLRRDLRQIETRLNDLAAKRMNVIHPDHLAAGPCHVERWPVNLPVKLLQGALAGFCVIVILIGLQMWLSPKAV
ncbi:MAG: hypothetical protein V2A79_11245 [Planctomycetota bacterium]